MQEVYGINDLWTTAVVCRKQDDRKSNIRILLKFFNYGLALTWLFSKHNNFLTQLLKESCCFMQGQLIVAMHKEYLVTVLRDS